MHGSLFLHGSNKIIEASLITTQLAEESMCDFFCQRMENDQGDLADILRASGLTGPPTTDHPISNSWQIPVEPPPFPPPIQSVADNFGDPFADLRDPLLHELAASPNFFDGLDGPTEMKRPCSMFSRMVQISPAITKASPVLSRAIGASSVIEGEMIKASSGSTGCGLQISAPRTTGIKRRKGQAKKVVCIPAPAAASSRPGEVVPSDLWAWRKYGQKPIKGSPYPRCSSSKGCSARKQVERSRTDPNMLVITYTSEHNHPWPTQRNALAGSTRSQPAKNSSSSSRISTHNRKPPPTSLKEEPMETMSSITAVLKEESGLEIGEFGQMFNCSYKPMIPDPKDDFFADLPELETDPMSLIYSKGLIGDKSDEESSSKGLDPFTMFD